LQLLAGRETIKIIQKKKKKKSSKEEA